MKFLTKVLATSASAVGLAALGATPAGAVFNGVVAPVVNSGGSTAVWQTTVLATLASMTAVDGFYRLCTTGPNTAPGDTCKLTTAANGGLNGTDGHIDSAQQNFAAIVGNFKDSNVAANNGLGIPGGGERTVIINSNGSSFGVLGTSPPYTPQAGTLGLAGGDGVFGNANDAGGHANASTVGIPQGANPPGGVGCWGGAAINPTLCLAGQSGAVSFPPLASCPGGSGLAGLITLLPGGLQPTNNTAANASELCVLDYDTNIGSEPAGQATGGAYVISMTVGNTSNIQASLNVGISDVPPGDFASAAFNTKVMDNQANIGAQIFKIIANEHVEPSALFFGADTADKVALQLPQLQVAFGGATAGVDACGWDDLGAQVAGSPASPSVDHDAMTVCFREDGSGTRETFRNIYDRTVNGDAPLGTFGTTHFLCQPAAQDGGGAIANGGAGYNKYYSGPNTSSGAEATCVINATGGAGKGGGIGYVNASRKDSASPARFYSVPVWGIDPDSYSALQLQQLVKCGEYPYWAPSTLGIANTTPAATLPAAQAVAFALSDVAVFNDTNSPDYIPLGDFQSGIALDKVKTQSPYTVTFTSSNCDSIPPFAALPRP
jgi:hypothetical protein